MKRIFYILFIVLFSLNINAQQKDSVEKSSPLIGVEVDRNCYQLDIEGVVFNDVLIGFYCYYNTLWFRYETNVVVMKGKKKIYKKKFKNSYLYVFNDGQVQVGQPKFRQIVVGKIGSDYYGKIRQFEGLYVW